MSLGKVSEAGLAAPMHLIKVKWHRACCGGICGVLGPYVELVRITMTTS